MNAQQVLDSMRATWTAAEILETSRLGLSPEDAASIGDADLADQVLGLVRLEAARIVGTRVGKAIAQTMQAEGMPLGQLSADDLSGEDGAQATAVGIEPGTDAWDAFEDAAIAAYRIS